MRRGSSGSVVSDYGLEDRAIEVRSPTGAEDFSSSPCVQTGSGAHPASYPMGTGVLSPGVKRGRGVTLTTHPHLVPRLSMSRSYTSSPQAPPWRVAGQLYLYLTFRKNVWNRLCKSWWNTHFISCVNFIWRTNVDNFCKVEMTFMWSGGMSTF
jgi:hypothetical protein